MVHCPSMQLFFYYRAINTPGKTHLVCLQMKRARIEDDFNPVYPYDTPNAPSVPFITPPFVSSDGLQEKPPGVLSLNYQDPITTQNGALTLKLGSGLDIDEEGQLTSDAGAITPPLTKIDKKLGLAYSDPLTLQNNKLTLAYEVPLNLQNGKLAITYTHPLSLQDNSLTLSYDNPLAVVNNKLLLGYNTPLTLQDNKLTLPYTAPLNVSSNSLTLSSARPLYTNSNNELSLATDAPLSTATGTLRLQSAAPLGLANQTLRLLYSSPLYLQNDFLSLSIQRPLAITSGGSLTLQLSQPLGLDNNALSLNTSAPLTVENGTLGVSLTAPLTLNNSAIGVTCNPPLTVSNSGISLNTGNGLTVNDNRLQVNIGSGLQFTSSGAITATESAVNAEPPLVYSNNKLSLNIGGGLKYSKTYDSIQVKNDIFRGLDIDYYGFLVPKLGTGLKFNSSSGNIEVVFPTTPDPDPDTLWTSANPSANCTFFANLDTQVWLSLVKAGGMVHGLISVKALSGLMLQPATNYEFLNLILKFDENGVKVNAATVNTSNEAQGTLESSATWGYRKNNTTDTNVTNAKGFMPNSTRYPRGGTSIQNQYFGNTYLNGNYNMPVPYTVTFNSVTTGYSIFFKWGIVRLQNPSLADCPFSYITEE